MTLISCILNYSYPIILGDLLATAPVKDSFKLPTFLEGVEKYLPDNLKAFPAKLVQKTYIIKDNLVVAVAGKYLENQEFIIRIKDFFKDKDCTENTLKEFIYNYESDKFLNSAYLLLYSIKDEKGHLMCPVTIGNNWKSEESKPFERILAIGSGSNDFINEARRYSKIEGWGIINEEETALSFNLVLLSGLLARESVSLETIKKYWGAGFELITFDSRREKFYKLDEFTYIVWRGTLSLESKKLVVNPFLILSYKYFGQVLVISTSTGNTPEGFAILPIDMDKSEVDKESLPKEFKIYGKHIINTFLIEVSNGEIVSPSILMKKDDDSFSQIFINFDDKGRLQIGISQQIIEKLTEDIISRTGGV